MHHHHFPADIFETPTHMTMQADLPGVAKDSIQIEILNDVLTVKAKSRAFEKATETLRHQEFEAKEFHRRFPLSARVDQSKIEAKFEEGVLTVAIAKFEAPKATVVEVK
jgi:HSP20 family protein